MHPAKGICSIVAGNSIARNFVGGGSETRWDEVRENKVAMGEVVINEVKKSGWRGIRFYDNWSLNLS